VTNEKRIQDFPPQFRAITEGWWWGTRPLIWYAFLAILAGTVFLRFTYCGRSLLAVGDSPSAARRIGLPQARLQCLAFALSGALAGLAGAFWASSYGIVDTYTAEGYELKAIAAAVLGGCAVTGGTGTALGAALGALMLELIRSALVILSVSAYWEGFCVGILILGVVVLDSKLQGASP
jgi:rhamnose transport system permease protein